MWSEFATPTLDEWLAIVAREAGGKTPEELSSRNWEGISYPAYCEPRPTAQSAVRSAGKPRLVQCLPRERALWEQARGAEVAELVLELQPDDRLGDLPPAEVLRGACGLGAMIALANRVPGVLAAEVDAEQLFHLQDANVLAEALYEARGPMEVRLTTQSWLAAGCDGVQELAWAFCALIEAWRALPTEHAGGVGLQLQCGPRILFESARLRAAQRLWQQVCRGFDLQLPPRVHVRQDGRYSTRADQHNGLLRSTLTATAALWGGASSVELLPVEDSEQGCRWARNVFHVLTYESGLGEFVDPLLGSGLIETLTEQIADQAWSELQRIEAAGGIAQQTDLCARAATRSDSLLSGITLVGVNRYAAGPPPARPLAPELLYAPATPCSSQHAGELLDAGKPLGRTGLLPGIVPLRWEMELK